MTHQVSNGVDRSSLKLTLQVKDRQYSVKESNAISDQEGSDQDSFDESASNMTDTTNETSLNDLGADNADELSNASSVVGDNQNLNDLGADNADELSNASSVVGENKNLIYIEACNDNKPHSSGAFIDDVQCLNDDVHSESDVQIEGISLDDHHGKTAVKKNDEESESKIIVKQEKENGNPEPEEDDKKNKKPDAGSDEEQTRSPENGDEGHGKDNSDEDISDKMTELAPEDCPPAPTQPIISVRKTEDLMMSRAQVNGSNEECSVCCERFGSLAALEQHRANAGHYSCDDCPKSMFQTPNDLSQHQALHHQPPVQQLAQQVQRLPATFTSPNYRAQTPPQQRNVYMPTPPMVPYYHPPPMMTPQEGSGGGLQQIGSGVVLSTVPSPQTQQQQGGQQVPNLPPGIQLSKRPAASQPPEASSPKQRRDDEPRSGIRLPDSITLVSRTPPQPQRRSESVTDMLANRGITLVPTAPPQPQSTSSIPRALMNTSAISITPSSQKQQPHRQASNFAVPAPKPVSRLLTVDLTKESDAPPRRSLAQRGRIRGPTGRVICQICDKAFPTQQELQQHMACHRGGSAPNKLAYECRECTAQYPTEAGLQAHRQKYHGAGGPSPDMAIPVVDLKQVGVMSRLAALGIRSVIPLSQLHSGSGGGLFGLPVVAVDSASNPAICNIGGLGASNLLPLGPLKNLSFNNNMR